MSKAEFNLSSIPDFSMHMIPGYADQLLDALKKKNMHIYEDEDVFVSKQTAEIDTTPSILYHTFDKKNGFPHYGLQCAVEDPSITISAITYDYNYIYEPSIFDEPIVTSIMTRAIPYKKSREVFSSLLDLDDITTYTGRGEKISHKVFFLDAKSKSLAQSVRQKFAMIPGEEILFQK